MLKPGFQIISILALIFKTWQFRYTMDYPAPKFKTSVVETGFCPDDEDTKKLYREVGSFAKQGQPVVIFGPSGAGKEFLARHYYNTLIKSEFYQQWKEGWQSKFDEIRKQYSPFYSDNDLRVFLNSLKAGIFQSINSATIYPNLAESILFGHEAGSFTDASTRPGLLESLKSGVLFMDEIGELPKYIQAKLLRAVDSEISEGCRLSGKLTYSLKDLIIISATNQPREKIRDDYYYRMGIEVNIKGIDERPKDVRKSIPHFICNAIGKRKDYAAVINMFKISGHRDLSKLSDAEEVKNFAREQGDLVAGEILIRKWPGNFRALRIVLEASVFRIETPDDLTSFSEKFRKNLKHYINQYSDDTEKTSVLIQKPYPDSVFPSRYPDMDRRIIEKISHKRSFQDMSDFEKKVLAVFISATHKTGFMRRDLEEYYKEHGSIRHTSEAHIRSRINKLVALKILDKTGNSKSTRYQLTGSFLEQVNLEVIDVFSVPEIDKEWTDRHADIETLRRDLLATERVYINAPPGYGKSAFITLFCNAMQKKYSFYYYPLGEAGINKMFEDMLKLLQSKKIRMDYNGILKDFVIGILPFIKDIFRAKKGTRPVLILDNAHFVSDPDEKSTIADLAKRWQEVILILSGNTMDNALLECFHEFRLGPWGKQA
jgi:hypothetical protein